MWSATSWGRAASRAVCREILRLAGHGHGARMSIEARYTSHVMNPARKMATWEDLLALPEDTRAEVIAGSVVTPPAPLPRHARAQRALGSFLGRPFDDDDGRGGPGGWWILLEVDVRLASHDIVRPDLAGWRRAKLPSPWDVRPIAVVPDWI